MNDRSLVLAMTHGIGGHLTNHEKRAHLTDLKREQLIDQVCIQEILPPEKTQQIPPGHGGAPKKERISPRIRLRHKRSGRRRDIGLHSVCGSGLVGTSMKSAIAAHLPDERFVIRVDGRVKSHHRRFLDALREGLQLRDQFPQHDLKVQSAGGRSARISLH